MNDSRKPFICRESNQNLSIISFILAWTFILLQLKEFRNMAFYINDSIFGSIFFFLTGLHFFHVVVGIILISIILGIVSIVSLPPASPNQATLHRLCDAGRRGSETTSQPWTSKASSPTPLNFTLDFLPYSRSSSMTQPSEVKQHNPSDRSSGWMKQWKKSIIHPVSASINNNGLSVPCDPLLKSGLLFLDGCVFVHG